MLIRQDGRMTFQDYLLEQSVGGRWGHKAAEAAGRAEPLGQILCMGPLVVYNAHGYIICKDC